jgi:hypothetical protein
LAGFFLRGVQAVRGGLEGRLQGEVVAFGVLGRVLLELLEHGQRLLFGGGDGL